MYQLVEEVYKTLTHSNIRKELGINLKELKDKIGVLYYTKKINPPYFFSFQFSIGVYLPILAPLIFPPLLTFTSYLKLWKLGKKEKKLKMC